MLLLAVGGVYIILDRGVAVAEAIHGGILPAPDSFDVLFVRRPLLTFFHLLPALLFIILGPLQFTAGIRNRFPAVHRWSGRVYLVAATFIAYSGVHLVLSRSFGGPSETAATIFFAALFVGCLGTAFWHIRSRRVRQHREWMIRGFAIGLAVVTIRPVVGLYLALSDYSVQEILGTAFWLSFTTHLIAAEVGIHFTRRGRVRV